MSEGLLAGKRGVILGVANERSIAWGCAKACAEQGASLALNYLGGAQEKRVRGLLEKELPQALCFPCDVSDDEEIAGFFKEIEGAWGTFDFLVHSIAYADRGDLKGRYLDTSRANFSMALDISAYSLVAVVQAAERLFNEGASVVAMTYYGAEKVVAKYNVMGVAKAALEASIRYLAADLGPDGIRINGISAGAVRTLSSAAFPGFRQMLSGAGKVAPLRRNVTHDEVANAAVYLLSSLSSGVTGEVHHVDCGYNVLGSFAEDDS